MVSLKNTHGHKQSSTALFDIRVKGTDHDVLVVKGSPHEANSILLSGTIVLSILEPMQIKSLSLKLYGTLRLKWTNSYETSRGSTIKKPFRYEKRLFEYNWDDFDLHNYLLSYKNYVNSDEPTSNSTSPSRPTIIKNHSSSSLKNLYRKSKSSTNLASFGSALNLSQQSFQHNSNILPEGNYEFPFSTILPGSVFESVEGLPGASVVYKLQATIDRGKFSNDLHTKKHLRIIRTLTPDAVELAETMAVDNTWPKKVEYSISIPSRAIAIGSSTPVNMLLVPLAKGLKLGKIKITLVENFSCSGSNGPPHTGERMIKEVVISDLYKNLSDDRWEINYPLQIPASLTKCTQDVDILTNIKVRHRLKFSIGLINPDGHISELRASLPIILFISPFVAVGIKTKRKYSVASASSADYEASYDEDDEEFYKPINSRSNSAANSTNGADDGNDGNDNDFLFAPESDLQSPNATQLDLSGKIVEDSSKLAPPNYENHIYDRLWNEIPIENTPEDSRAVTPVGSLTPVGMTAQGESLDMSNVGKLTENLRKIHLQRMNQQNSLDQQFANSDSGGNYDEYDDDDDNGLSFKAGNRPVVQTPINNIQLPSSVASASASTSAAQQDYFSIPLPNNHHQRAISSPGGVYSRFNHISRVNSTDNLQASSIPVSPKEWDFNSLTKVPSYQAAMRSPTPDLTPASLPPEYEDPELLLKPKTIHLKSSSLNNSRAQSTAYLSSLRSAGLSSSADSQHNNMDSIIINKRGSSQNTSPTLSRNASATNLQSIASKSPGKLKYNASFTQVSQLNPTHKSGSFVNLMGGILGKKDKK